MINSKELNDFLSLSDEELKGRLEKAAVAAGADPSKVKILLGDPNRIRNLVSTLTPRDAERLVAMFGKERAAEVAESLKGSGKD